MLTVKFCENYREQLKIIIDNQKLKKYATGTNLEKPLSNNKIFGETHLAQDVDLPGNPKCVVKHLKPKSLEPEVLDEAKKLFEREAEYPLSKLG